jgi:hypothetical protein
MKFTVCHEYPIYFIFRVLRYALRPTGIKRCLANSEAPLANKIRPQDGVGRVYIADVTVAAKRRAEELRAVAVARQARLDLQIRVDELVEQLMAAATQRAKDVVVAVEGLDRILIYMDRLVVHLTEPVNAAAERIVALVVAAERRAAASERRIAELADELAAAVKPDADTASSTTAASTSIRKTPSQQATSMPPQRQKVAFVLVKRRARAAA